MDSNLIGTPFFQLDCIIFSAALHITKEELDGFSSCICLEMVLNSESVISTLIPFAFICLCLILEQTLSDKLIIAVAISSDVTRFRLKVMPW